MTHSTTQSASPGQSQQTSRPAGHEAMPRRDPLAAPSDLLAQLVIPGLLLWLCALMVHSSADIPSPVAAIAAAIGTVGVVLRLPLLSRRRWFWLVIAGLGILFVVRFAVFAPVAQERGFVVIPRSLTISIAEFLLCCQVVCLWRWDFRDPLPITVPGLALLTLVVALNKALPKDSQAAHVFLVTVSLLIPVLMARYRLEARSGGTSEATLPWAARFVTILVCISIFVGTWAATEIWIRWLPDAQLWFATRVGRTINTQQRLKRYSTAGTLTSIRNINAENPNAIALRVYADRKPGYLAGRIFDHYHAGQWLIAADRPGLLGNRRRRGMYEIEPLDVAPSGVIIPSGDFSAYDLSGGRGEQPVDRMTIENDPRRGRVYFTPSNYRYFVGEGGPLIADDHGIVRAGIDVHAPYSVFRTASARRYPLDSWQREILSTPPDGIDPRVEQLADQVARGDDTFRDKIAAVRDHFQNNHEYSLKGFEAPGGIGVLSYFLLTRQPAHCEFFASGAARWAPGGRKSWRRSSPPRTCSRCTCRSPRRPGGCWAGRSWRPCRRAPSW